MGNHLLSSFKYLICDHAVYNLSPLVNDASDLNIQERSVLLTGILYVGPVSVTVFILNTVAASYGATAALPFGTIIVIILIYTFLAVPLLAIGGIIGNHFRSEFQAPSATKRVPREIPLLTWYQKTPCQMFLVGLLSFSAIALELHHLYATMWGYKIYTLPSILFVMFVVLFVLTVMLSVGLTYIQLSLENHEWWWRYALLHDVYTWSLVYLDLCFVINAVYIDVDIRVFLLGDLEAFML